MNKGNFQGENRFGPIKWSLALALWVGLAGVTAMAKENFRYRDYKKVQAPNLENHAEYFSENRKGISAKDLARADSLRVKTIRSISSILDSKKKSSRRFELLLRLGELHVERHDYLRDLEMRDYQKNWDQWVKDGKKTPEPQLRKENSENEMLSAISSFRRLVSE